MIGADDGAEPESDVKRGGDERRVGLVGCCSQCFRSESPLSVALHALTWNPVIGNYERLHENGCMPERRCVVIGCRVVVCSVPL